MPSSPSPSYSASFPSSPSSSPSFGPVDSSPPSSPNLHPLSSPPDSPRPTDPFAGGTKGVKRPRIYEKRQHRWADQIDSPDNSFDVPDLPTSPSRRSHISLLSESEFDFLSDHEDSEADEDEFWERTISQAIDNGNGLINLNNSLIHDCLTTIPPSIGDLANLVVLHTHTRRTPPLPARPPHKRQFRRVVTEPAIKPSGFPSGSGLAKAPSFVEVSDTRPQNEVQILLANHAVRRLPVELFWVQNLTVLNLRGNALTYMPPQISNLSNLRDLNISLNKLAYLPAEMLRMRLDGLSVSGNNWMPPPRNTKQGKAVPWRSRKVVDVKSIFTVPRLSELCLRTLLSPHQSQQSVQSKDETVLEALYALPLSGTEYYPRALVDTLHACIPSAVAKPDVHIEASPAKKARRSTSTAHDPFKRTRPAPSSHLAPGPQSQIQDTHGKETLPGIGVCPSPIHSAQGRKAVFVNHAEERFTWEYIIAGILVGEPLGVPLHWRGCSQGCLDFLGSHDASDSDDATFSKQDQEGALNESWEGDTEGATTDVEENSGIQAINFGDGELGFD